MTQSVHGAQYQIGNEKKLATFLVASEEVLVSISFFKFPQFAMFYCERFDEIFTADPFLNRNEFALIQIGLLRRSPRSETVSRRSILLPDSRETDRFHSRDTSLVISDYRK